MKAFIMSTLILTILLFSCVDNTNKTPEITKASSAQYHQSSDTLRNDSNYVFTGLYSLEEGQGIKMKVEHSDEVYNISKIPLASVKNILRATAQKNIVQEHDTCAINLVFDNEGTKYIEEATDNPSYPNLAVVMANRLFYVVPNTSKIKTGIMEVILVDYTEKEVNDLIDAINQKK